MPIIVSCTGCGRKLRLADEHAGKTARCPVCRMTFQIPADAARVSDSTADAAGAQLSQPPDDSLGLGGSAGRPFGSSAPSGFAPTEERWHMKTPEGQEYGPVSRSELDGWVREGRISADCWLRREGNPQWLNPRELFPQIAPSSSPGMAPGGPRGPGANPYADRAPAGMPTNPYASPYSVAGPGVPGYGYPFKKPHRGGTILALGIAGFCLCIIISIVTLVMANQDLTEMDQGIMDDSGRGLTRAGQIIAIIGLCLNALGILIQIMAAAAN